MRFRALTVRLLLLLAIPLSASAYDIDVHFYQTYSMARYAGLRHEAAALIAASAQWPDETVVVASPFWEFKSRRLFHFPCFTKAIALEDNRMGEKTDKDDPLAKAKAEHVDWCETEHDHPMAYLLMYEGMCHDCDPKTNKTVPDALKGDLLKAATALHTIEDSYAHEGTPAEVGHAAYGHWPDRAYNPDGSVDKFYEMVGSAMYGIYALREVLGGKDGKFCDKSVRDPSPAVSASVRERPNCERSAVDLAKGYRALPLLKRTIERNILIDPAYVEPVIGWALTKMQDVSHSETSGRLQFWMNPSFDVMKWLYRQDDVVAMMRSGKSDVYAVMKVAFPRLYKLDPAAVAEDLWKPSLRRDHKKFILSKYALLANLYWLNTPNPRIKELDQQISDADIEIRGLFRLAREALENKKDKNKADALKAQARAKMGPRDKLQADREDLRLALVSGFETDYYKDPSNSFDRLMHDMVERMLYTNVPRPLNARHRFEYENDGAYPRRLELQIRITGVRSMIEKLYGTNVRFVSNKPKWAYASYQAEHPDQTKDFAPEDQLVAKDVVSDLKQPEALVTLNYRQINLWNDQMLRFTFPLITDAISKPGDGKPLIEEFSDDGAWQGVLTAISHYAGYAWKNGVTQAYLTPQKDYLDTHLVAPIDMTAKIKDERELKQLVGNEFRFSNEQLGFLEELEGPKRSFIKDPNPQATGLLRQPQASQGRLP
jgi:hypothetical protein